MARQRRLKKTLTDVLKIEVIGGTGEMTFDPKSLPTEVQAHLPVLGLSHKLGDTASGLDDPAIIEDIITKLWEAMMKGEFTVRQPGQPKVSLKDVKDNLAGMAETDREAALTLLRSLGIKV